MEEKKKVSFITALLVLIVIMLITVASLMYVEIQNTKAEVEELNEKISNLEQDDGEEHEDNKGVTGTFIEFANEKNEGMLTETPVEKVLYAIHNDETKVNEIMNNYCHKYSWFYAIGDSASWTSWECNYNQYKKFDVETMKKLEEDLEPINSVIEFKIADLTEHTDNVAPMSGVYLSMYDSLTEKVNLQYERSLNDDKRDEYSRISRGEPHFGITGMLIMNGNNESEEEYNNNSRAKKIKITINNEEIRTIELKDTNEPQLIDIDYKQNHIKTPLDVKIEVLETYKGLKTNDVYITDIGFATVSSINGSR